MNTVEILNLIGRPNAYYPNLARPLGGVNAAVLFSQLFYWQDKATSDLGVYKTRDELEEETGLTHNEQRTAIRKLVEKGVLIVTEKRLDHKTFYKINNEKVNEIFVDFADSFLSSPRDIESKRPDLDNVEFGEATKSSSLDQEITTKITSEITTNIVVADTPKKQKRACQLPDDFKPSEQHRVLSQSLNINLNNEFLQFKDYHLSKGSKMLDWNAALRNWIRNAVKFQNNTTVKINQFSSAPSNPKGFKVVNG